MKFAIIVAALGYFVDVYDLILFSVVRSNSLRALGVPEDQLLSSGVYLLNMQMAGMLLGGILWGVAGDKKGRIWVMFGSIFIYSAANIANGFVQDVSTYALLRLIAGIGLAGELGAGITLVSEIILTERRGLGTTIVASFGVAGALLAATVGELFDWRTSYYIGGAMGLALLVLRIAVYESGLFQTLKDKTTKRGDLVLLLSSRQRVWRYLSCIFIGLPIWFVVGILITFSPELGKELGITPTPVASRAVFYCYVGLVIGDICSGLLSQYLRSRKKVILLFIVITAIFSYWIIISKGISAAHLYALCIPVGFGVGYWAVFVTTAAEQFGTNLRATVATTVPNFVRGAVVPLTSLFKLLKDYHGIANSALYVGIISVCLALLALWKMEESFHKHLDFLEE